VERKKKSFPLHKLEKGMKRSCRSFKKAIAKPGRLNIIAEIKKKSPSKGIIVKNFRPVRIAGIYEKSGADAISVLTDNKYFGGSMEDLKSVSGAAGIPVLCKEFMIDEYQVYEARKNGADAILIIAAIHGKETIKRLMGLSQAMGMDCIVEVHDRSQVHAALEAGAAIIGINNRDLRDFSVDLETTLRLKKAIPADRVVVSESGIKTAEDMRRIYGSGVNAVLIGAGILGGKDMGKKIKELRRW